MVRFALGVLVVALAMATSCILSREGGLPVETTGATGGGTSLGGGGSSSGTTGGAGGLGGGPSCGDGYECVPEPGGGRIIRLITEPFGVCPSGWEDAESFYDGTIPDCGACVCESATGGSCAPGAVYRYLDNSCNSQMGQSATNGDQVCVSVDTQDPNQADGYRVDPSTANGGSCDAMELDTPDLPLEIACGVEHPISGACPNEGICVPTGSTDTGNACVLVAGSGPCPAGYPNPTVLYDSSTVDSRDCACTCGSPSGTCTGDQIDLFNTDSCGTPHHGTVPADGNCHDVSTANAHDGYRVTAGTWSGSCTPSAAPTGEVIWGAEHTLCCP